MLPFAVAIRLAAALNEPVDARVDEWWRDLTPIEPRTGQSGRGIDPTRAKRDPKWEVVSATAIGLGAAALVASVVMLAVGRSKCFDYTVTDPRPPSAPEALNSPWRWMFDFSLPHQTTVTDCSHGDDFFRAAGILAGAGGLAIVGGIVGLMLSIDPSTRVTVSPRGALLEGSF